LSERVCRLRQTGIVSRQGRLRLRQFKQGVRQKLRLGYGGRRRKPIELLKRLLGQLLVGLINDSNKLLNPSKRVRSAASRLLQKLSQKTELL
jgi:hypothetical protein